MKEMSVLEYLKETGLLEEIAKTKAFIPNTIDSLYDMLEDLELNYWSYSIEDADEVEDNNITVLVKDIFNNKRYFEILETVSW